MPAPTDLTSDINRRIAFAKNWRWVEEVKLPGTTYCAHWEDSSGQWKESPDFVGTLEGVTGLYWELQRVDPPWTLQRYDGYRWVCWQPAKGFLKVFFSLRANPGGCIGEAWMSEHEEEATHAS